jgi:hypothetical protein
MRIADYFAYKPILCYILWTKKSILINNYGLYLTGFSSIICFILIIYFLLVDGVNVIMTRVYIKVENYQQSLYQLTKKKNNHKNNITELKMNQLMIKKNNNNSFKFNIIEIKDINLDDMTYNQAIKYDKRKVFKVCCFYIIKDINCFQILCDKGDFELYCVLIQGFIFSNILHFTINCNSPTVEE